MEQKRAFNIDEKGSAILLSLGILSLVLILAMSFAFSANTQKSIAKTQGAATSARMVADEAVELAIADMGWMFEETERTAPSAIQDLHVYPPEAMNGDPAYDSTPKETYTYTQNCFLWKRFNAVSSSDMNTQYYLLSTDVSRTGSVSAWEQYHVGRLFGLTQTTSETEDSYTATNLANDWLESSDLKGNVNFMPQLQFLGPAIKGELGFASPLTMTYQLHDEDGKNNKDVTKVTGRYAYILLDEAAKFDLNAVINLTGYSPAAIDHPSKTAVDQNRVLGGGMYCDRLAPAVEVINSGNNDDKYEYDVYDASVKDASGRLLEEAAFRMGLLPEEVVVDEKYVDFMQDMAKIGETVKAPYESYEQLCASTLASSNTDKTSFIGTSASDSDMFKYTFFGLEDIEAYWDEKKQEEIQRFDLSGISWGGDGSTPKLFEGDDNAWEYGKGSQEKSRELIWRLCGLELDTKADGDVSENALPFWDDRAAGTLLYSVEKTTNDMESYEGYLDWLHRMVDDDGNEVGVQVAANIKDFSDSDDFASTDFNITEPAPASDGTDYAKPEGLTEPTYCGNERVCYFNEIAVKSNSWGELNTTSGTWNYTVSLRVGVEMLNIYCLLGMSDCGASSGKTSSDGKCTVELGNIHVKVVGNLHVWRQKYEEKADPNFTGEGTAPKVWLPVEGGLDECFVWPLKSSDATGSGYLSLNSYDSDSCFELAGGTKNLSADEHHLGFTTFYLEKKKDLNSLQEIVGTATDAELASIRTDMAEKGGNEYHFCFLFEITNVVAYSTSTEDDNLEHLYDVAVMPTGGADEFTESTQEIAKDLLSDSGECGSDLAFKNNKTIVSFQAKDCRFNHRSDKKIWVVKCLADAADGTEATNLHTLGDDNTDGGTTVYGMADSVDAKVDMEQAVGFKAAGSEGQHTFSTAFIRNAPMKSLWELGAIHRGYPNQTINLKEYGDKADIMYYSTAVKASGGDAGILDQVKIGPLMFVRGKINANQRNPKVWKQLLTADNMYYEWYDRKVSDSLAEDAAMAVVGVNAKGWKLDSTQLTLLESGKAWKDLPLDRPTSLSRGTVADMLETLLMSSSDKPANDRDYESYIGKAAGLLTTRCEAYSLLLVAETLNDMTDELSATEWNAIKDTLNNPQTIQYDANGDGKVDNNDDSRYCTVTGRQKVLVHLLRDAWRGEITVHSKKYLEVE